MFISNYVRMRRIPIYGISEGFDPLQSFYGWIEDDMLYLLAGPFIMDHKIQTLEFSKFMSKYGFKKKAKRMKGNPGSSPHHPYWIPLEKLNLSIDMLREMVERQKDYH